MSVLHPSSIRPFLTFRPRHHIFPNTFSSKRAAALLRNDGVLPTAGVFTKCFEENLLPNGALLPNSTHRSVSFLYQFLVLTEIFLCPPPHCDLWEMRRGKERPRRRNTAKSAKVTRSSSLKIALMMRMRRRYSSGSSSSQDFTELECQAFRSSSRSQLA
jgi:hypothetical protein